MNNVIFLSVQLHAISKRLRDCCYPSEVYSYEYDFSHVLDFCSKLRTIYVRGGRSNVGTSNLVYNNMSFDLTIFKSLQNLFFYNVQLGNINDFGSLRRTVSSLTAYNSNIKQFADVLLCDKIHKTYENIEDAWSSLTKIDISWNELTRIDQSIVLTPKLQSLTLDGNQIKKIENTEMLPNLTHLCASANNIVIEECLSSKLKNVVQLNLSQNKITKLSPFSQLNSMKDLNLGSNLICESS